MQLTIDRKYILNFSMITGREEIGWEVWNGFNRIRIFRGGGMELNSTG